MLGYSSLVEEDQFRVTMRIFNAYRLPPDGNKLLYDSITPVNSFRLIFNYYFGTDYELLSDRSYRSGGYEDPYRKFIDVTEILEND